MVTVTELRATAKNLGIRGYSTMRKAELEEAIRDHGRVSEARVASPRRSPARSPRKSPAGRKSPSKSPAGRKSPSKSPAGRKSPSKSPAGRKSPSKSPVRKSPRKSPAAKLQAGDRPASMNICKNLPKQRLVDIATEMGIDLNRESDGKPKTKDQLCADIMGGAGRKSPRKSPSRSPVRKSPSRSPVRKSPVRSPRKSPFRVPSPVRSPVKEKTPVRSPARSEDAGSDLAPRPRRGKAVRLDYDEDDDYSYGASTDNLFSGNKEIPFPTRKRRTRKPEKVFVDVRSPHTLTDSEDEDDMVEVPELEDKEITMPGVLSPYSDEIVERGYVSQGGADYINYIYRTEYALESDESFARGARPKTNKRDSDRAVREAAAAAAIARALDRRSQSGNDEPAVRRRSAPTDSSRESRRDREPQRDIAEPQRDIAEPQRDIAEPRKVRFREAGSADVRVFERDEPKEYGRVPVMPPLFMPAGEPLQPLKFRPKTPKIDDTIHRAQMVLPSKPSQKETDNYYKQFAGEAVRPSEPVQWDKDDQVLYHKVPAWDDSSYAAAVSAWPMSVDPKQAESVFAEFEQLSAQDSDLIKVRKSIMKALGY
ncbi:neurofilament triplet H1-like protein [Terrapene carolina carolina ranavirus]|uniref:Neurofilament triplet H1-like protein n=2 Tax=Ranavirus rana1 TaxID=3391521 RepID=A0A2U9QH24_FRG3V|nr:neurofilament triplet H1-like protein [Terrapene carolina carolina ranavirus]AWU46886.1 neurofilament triplet H1-like protein [Trioceros melleri ranavirus]AWU46981.1 neurofilament triplet H1-like protein [Trioceros melleri ranavirus]